MAWVQIARCPAATRDNAVALVEEVVRPLLRDPAPSVRDNACGALARALLAHRGLLAEEQLLQVRARPPSGLQLRLSRCSVPARGKLRVVSFMTHLLCASGMCTAYARAKATCRHVDAAATSVHTKAWRAHGSATALARCPGVQVQNAMLPQELLVSLPLRRDFDEAAPVVDALTRLMLDDAAAAAAGDACAPQRRISNPPCLTPCVNALAALSCQSAVPLAVRERAAAAVHALHACAPAEVQAAVQALPPDQQATLRQLTPSGP